MYRISKRKGPENGFILKLYNNMSQATNNRMNHLEMLIEQYYEWKGYIVRNNVKVGRLSHGGWAGELDIVVYNPVSNHLLHLEPQIDAHPWETREKRFKKKAVLINSSRKRLGGGAVVSIDELMRDVKSEIAKIGIMAKHAIPEQFDLLRTIQVVMCES